MDFKIKPINVWEGRTKNGSVVSFNSFKEDLLQLHKEGDTDSDSKATCIQLKCNFPITVQMADLLDQSKVIHVNGFSNEEGTIDIYPLFGFTLEKLTDVLYDMSQKFEL